MSKGNLQELLKLGFQHIGDFLFEANRLNLRLNGHKTDTGSYAFVVDQTVVYIGVTKNTLYARMNGYKNPGPSQETNKRIKPKIIEAQIVPIYFLPETHITKFTTAIQGDQTEKKIPTDMMIFERFLISMFQPEWNLY
jgi:hypothetical protein